MASAHDLGILVVTLLGGGTIGGIIVKWQNRDVDRATADKLHAEAKSTAQEAAKSEVDVIRDVLAEVRDQDKAKTEEIKRLYERDAAREERMAAMEGRLEKLEERERHMLTRAAVHEAWDQMSFNLLVKQHPNHPSPPPLRGELE